MEKRNHYRERDGRGVQHSAAVNYDEVQERDMPEGHVRARLSAAIRAIVVEERGQGPQRLEPLSN